MEIRSGPVEPVVGVEPTELGHRYARGRAHLTFAPDGADFSVEAGERITVTARPGTDLRVVHASLVGPVLGVLMVQRGALTLHASAVRVADRAIAIAGPSEIGKSTLAAALALEGYPVVTDDVLAFPAGAPATSVIPAHPLVKLWPDSARALGIQPGTLQVIEPGFDKLAFDAGASFDPAPLPLGGIALPGDVARPARVAEPEAMIELVKVLYAPAAIHATGDEAAHFERLARIVRSVPVFRVPVEHAGDPWRSGRRLIEAYLAMGRVGDQVR